MQGSSKKYVTVFGVKVTEEDAVRFISAKAKNGSSCPVCGNLSRIAMLTGPENDTACIVPTAVSVEVEGGQHQLEVLAGGRFMPVWHLWCDDCGYLEAHTLGVLATWTRENPADKEGAGRHEQAE